ncbi:MAG: 4-(cytidine 5'-diphospho)-2-C-methyl-D-erythritol kinase, partial [Rhizomicrobium sp.]
MSDVTNSVREFAPAKINLFLHVGQKRADGFHDLESLVVFARTGDVLTFETADDLTLTIDGPFAGVLSADDDNLVLKAARALAARAKIVPQAHITLTKKLPVASGIGGGSADAAAALRGLNTLWGLRFIPDQLRSVGVAFGSDIPVCIEPQAAWMAGRGERVS